MRTAVVMGTGLIGTSVALSLSERGVRVHLCDRDPEAVRIASDRGAGISGWPEERVDLAIVAVPPSAIAASLDECRRRNIAFTYTDVGSVKAHPLREMESLGCDLTDYVGGHPMAGSERSGPHAADKDLFRSASWAVVPNAASGGRALNHVLELVSLCGATPVVMNADEHDAAVALVSHAPYLIAALLAGRLCGAAGQATRLAGRGVRDVTRVAGSDPLLWSEILRANAAAVADILTQYAGDLQQTVEILRGLAARGTTESSPAEDELLGLLARGVAGRAEIC
ncbi:prephenate dehydrogenase [Yinghuangia sp. ASG 101]|uniref:prephenate dehydrogenase n=1 Tax=Yinghuangia sp. ASG 101 TaxID=2896848 RepID=UPI001E467640|nr:prephenate dehydrogenase [Yinghuangia sp. ASG 101]UGQ12306.1 prephenate dehydrogenase [Yinghuangia sp. ASG 101]